MIELYRTHYRVYLAWALQYRVMIALWAIAGIVETLVALAVWSAVAAAGGGDVGGYSQSHFAAYFVLVMLVSELTHTWIFWMWEWRVREGAFSALLLRPAHPLHADLIDNVAVKTISMAVKIPIAVVIGLAYDARWTTDPEMLGLLAISLVLAYALRFLLESVIACFSFWLTRMQALIHAWYLAWAFLSGAFAPIELLPGWLRPIAEALPMQWALGFPVKLGMGQLTAQQAWHGIAMQVAWIAGTWVLFHVLWRAASRRFTAVGS